MGEKADVKDVRSTGRKRARRALEQSGRPYACECEGECGSDACGVHTASDNRVQCGYTPENQSRSDTLDANHKNKNWLDNDPANLEWLCRPCHRALDRRTEKGVMHEEHINTMYGNMLEEIPDW